MNFWYTGFLILWCILIIGNCYQGQNLIIPDTDKTDSNIYIYFQVLSTTTSVMFAVLIASTICIKYCHQDKWERDTFLAFIIFPLTLIQITMFGLIGTNIESVSGYSDTKNFKIILSVCGGVSAIPVFHSLYKIIKYLFPTAAEKAERERNEELVKNEQIARHKRLEDLDSRSADKIHKMRLEVEQRELQRQNELIIRNADQEVLSQRRLLEKQKADIAAERKLEDIRVDAERSEQRLAEEKRDRESSINIDRMSRSDNLRIQQQQRDRRQKEIEEAIEMRKLQQEKQLQESLYKKDLERQRQERIDQEELSVKKIKRLKDVAEYNRDQLRRKLELALLGKTSSKEINYLEEEISDLTKEINSLGPTFPKRGKREKDKDSTIAELPPDENDQDCKEMNEKMGNMKECNASAQRDRDYFHGRRNRLSKHCPDNYREMDYYEEKCSKDKKCNQLKLSLSRDSLDECNGTTKFLRKGYKTGHYDHCTNEIPILNKYIEKCDAEEKYGDSSETVEPKSEAPPRPIGRPPKIEGTIAQLPSTPQGGTIAQLPQWTSSGGVRTSIMEAQNSEKFSEIDDEKRDPIHFTQKIREDHNNAFCSVFEEDMNEMEKDKDCTTPKSKRISSYYDSQDAKIKYSEKCKHQYERFNMINKRCTPHLEPGSEPDLDIDPELEAGTRIQY